MDKWNYSKCNSILAGLDELNIPFIFLGHFEIKGKRKKRIQNYLQTE
jgi:hypothetical protein